MMYELDEIENYLKKCVSIKDAIDNLSDENIVNANPVDYSKKYLQTEENLLKYEEHIGMKKIKEYARLNGKRWMACSPRWTSDKRDLKTEFHIYYWVNYGDDQTYGSFTVEQIKEWLTTPKLKLYTLGGTKEK
jgi:hypothetical protein